MSEYHIVLEELLTSSLRIEIIEKLEKSGYIRRNVKVKKKDEDTYYISIICDEYHLGNVVSFLLSRFKWIMVEKMTSKEIFREDCVDINLELPF